MGVTPLNPVQQGMVDVLLGARRIERVPVDLARATAFMQAAEERMQQLPLLTSAAVRCGIAYDASHDVGEALLAAYGCRTTNGGGQHEALGRYLRAVIDQPPTAAKAAQQFDRIRRDRNRDRYQARPVGVAVATRAEQVAQELFEAAIVRGVTP